MRTPPPTPRRRRPAGRRCHRRRRREIAAAARALALAAGDAVGVGDGGPPVPGAACGRPAELTAAHPGRLLTTVGGDSAARPPAAVSPAGPRDTKAGRRGRVCRRLGRIAARSRDLEGCGLVRVSRVRVRLGGGVPPRRCPTVAVGARRAAARAAPVAATLNYVSPILACAAEGPSVGRMACHQATPQRLEPVGPDRDCGAGVPRRTHRAAPGRRHRNTTAVSPHDTGAGPDQPRSQPARLTRTTTSPTTVLIRVFTRPLTSPESLWNRVVSGAEVRAVDQCSTDTALNVTLRPDACSPIHGGSTRVLHPSPAFGRFTDDEPPGAKVAAGAQPLPTPRRRAPAGRVGAAVGWGPS